TTFDYEFAWLQHQLGCRAATKVVVPEAIPSRRLATYGAEPPKLVQYEGLKEEYYLADFEPDPAVVPQLGVDPARVLVVLRPPPRGDAPAPAVRARRGRLVRTEHREHVAAVARKLRRADARHRPELREVARLPGGNLGERAVVENDVGRLLVGRRPIEPPPLQ